MIKIYVKKLSNYPINTPQVKKKLIDFFVKHGIVSDADCVIAFVGESVMMDLAKKYLKENKIHNVLSFVEGEVEPKFVKVNTNTIHLGEIVICYPRVVEEAKEENRLISEKIYELLEHGAFHLMGIHHD